MAILRVPIGWFDNALDVEISDQVQSTVSSRQRAQIDSAQGSSKQNGTVQILMWVRFEFSTMLGTAFSSSANTEI